MSLKPGTNRKETEGIIRSYKISGMSCNECTQTVNIRLSQIAGVKKVGVDLEKQSAEIQMERNIPLEEMINALSGTIYTIEDLSSASESTNLSTKKVRRDSNRELVRGYFSVMAKKDFNNLRQYLDPDFQFIGATTINSSEKFIENLKEHFGSNAPVNFKYELKASFIDLEEACIIYDIIPDKQVEQIAIVEWLNIKNGKIFSSRLKFDGVAMQQLVNEIKK